MTKKERAQMIVERLEQVYPEGICSLDYKKPHELMIAGRLSAQCTDARVNIVTKELFAKYKTIEDFANAEDRKSTRLNSSHPPESRMPSSA